MAQLSDDCFAFGGPMMSVDEAVGIIAARVTAVHEVEAVSLGQADGRVLAGDILAPLPLPPFTNSAVDGYAASQGAAQWADFSRTRFTALGPRCRYERVGGKVAGYALALWRSYPVVAI